MSERVFERAHMTAAIVMVLLGVAHADPGRTTVSVEPRAFVAHGIDVEAEQDLPRAHVSVAGSVALRSTAGGDYDSTTTGVGAEVRYWLRRRAIWTKRPRGSAIGWYVAARLDVAHTSLRDGMDESLGAMNTFGTAALIGYRFAPWRGLEVRPYVGLATHTDTGGGLPAWTRPSMSYGLSLGWTF
jgi:hypothetical protein